MRCPFCKKENDKVIDSRTANEGAVIRRRRECEACGKRYTTYERMEDMPLFVIKKDHRRELFEAEKGLNGIHKACQKRPVPLEVQDRIAEELEKMLREKYEKEVPSKAIGEFVMHYHDERPHQGLANDFVQGRSAGKGVVDMSDRLGGLLKYYHRRAA